MGRPADRVASFRLQPHDSDFKHFVQRIFGRRLKFSSCEKIFKRSNISIIMMQQQQREPLMADFIQLSPLHNVSDATITWAPKKNLECRSQKGFCRRCASCGGNCNCSESFSRNPQRRLDFFDITEQKRGEVNEEATPNPASIMDEKVGFTKCVNSSAGLIERAKNLGEYLDLLPQVNSKRKLIYAEATES
eukprot:Seg3613.2 transcript_id=Seg3613.2/GoldUCD/mRNA.D3Y31 product="hypothetical protein" protein_id=Seg3613.2/GoldUCD/D3Y31